MDQYSAFAHLIFSNEVKKRRERYYNLQKQLRQALMTQTYEVYVSVAYLTSVIVGVVGAILGLVAGFLLSGFILHGTNLSKVHTGINLPPVLYNLAPFLVVLVAMIILGLVGYAICFMVFMLLPAMTASDRKSKINKGLPSAVTFMYAMSKGGSDIIAIIRSLTEAQSTYGEVSKEIGFIVRDMDYFGNDLRLAITNCINQTPSDLLQDLLSNLLSVIDSGGDVTAYLSNKVEQYRMRIIQDQKSFLEILGLIAESYVTAFVAGPLFIIIMVSVMTIMNGGSPMMLYILIYFALPVGSIMFVIMISMMTPSDDAKTDLFAVDVQTQYDTVPDEPGQDVAREQKKVADLKKAKEKMKTREFLRNPIAGIRKEPIKALYISVPAAIVIVAVLIALTSHGLTDANAAIAKYQHDVKFGLIKANGDPLAVYGPLIGYFDDFIVYFMMIALIPLTYFYEKKNRRERKIATEMPDFLKKLASTNETGMTLTQSLNLIANSNFGTLNTEVQKVHKDLQWGTDVNTALKRLGNDLRTNTSTKVITLITKAASSSGDIKDVLNIAASDARINEQIRKERSDGMLIYVVIIFLSFVVFIYCVYTLTSSFIPVMASAAAGTASSGAGASAGAGASGGASSAVFIQNFNPDDYVRLFFHAALIQGLCAGVLAGQMGEGNWMSGLKYALIMVAIAYVMFAILI